MAMSGNFTLFTNDAGVQSGAIDYVKDAFADISLPATNNTGFSSTLSKNPLGDYFADDDSPKYGAKTLFIKDLLLIEDRSLWISNKPTYRIIWNESFPGVNGYVFGTLNLARNSPQSEVQFLQVGGGAGVTGVIRKAIWLVAGSTAATATAQMQIDAVNSTTANFSNLTSEVSGTIVHPKYIGFDATSSLQTKDIHDYRILANEPNTLQVVGVIVYFENAGANLDLFPGTTYVDKNKSTSTTGATLALPSVGSTLGAKSSIYQTASAIYGVTSTIVTQLSSISQGSSGTNLLTVTTGQGASFPAGTGLIVQTGALGQSMYVGGVQSVSTDTLTVLPILPFGVSGSVYKAWQAGPTLAIDPNTYELMTTFGPDQFIGFSTAYLDPRFRYSVWGTNYSFVNREQDSVYPCLNFNSSSYLQIDGDFAAAEIETVGEGTLHATLLVNAVPGYGLNEGQTGIIKRTVMTGAGPGWNSFNMAFGSSQGSVGVHKINLYQVRRPIGLTIGVLAEFSTQQGFVDRGGYGATQMAIGLYRRYYSDALALQGPWTRVTGTGMAGAVSYQGSTSSCSINMEFYGSKYGIIGTAGSSVIATLDGSPVGATFNVMNSVTEGFHKLIVTPQANTTMIQAIDVARTRGELKNIQNYYSSPDLKKLQFKKVPIVTSPVEYTMVIGPVATPPTKGATRFVDNASWWRVGKMMFIRYDYEQTAGGSAGTGPYLFPLPPGHQVDMNFIHSTNGTYSQNNAVVGSFAGFGAGGGEQGVTGWVQVADATNLKLVGYSQGAAAIVPAGAGALSLDLTTVRYSFLAQVPILGWGVDE